MARFLVDDEHIDEAVSILDEGGFEFDLDNGGRLTVLDGDEMEIEFIFDENGIPYWIV